MAEKTKKKSTQTTRGKDSAAPEKAKPPRAAGLLKLIDLANLIPADWMQTPKYDPRKGWNPPKYDPQELLEIVYGPLSEGGAPAKQELPADLRLNLLELLNRPHEWPASPAKVKAEYDAVEKRYGVKLDNSSFNALAYQQIAKIHAVQDRYRLICRLNENLRKIANGRFDDITVTAKLKRQTVGNGKPREVAAFDISDDPFAQAITGEEVFEYLRECRKLKCNRLFYAARSDQYGCCTEHSAAIYKRTKRLEAK